jgi:hypothetical protein
MDIKVTNWKVSTLIKKRDRINDQPEYQRGEVWSNEKKGLLIDSILRGIDIPKIYLRLLNNKHHDFEVADGQQRLNALYNFRDDKFKLLNKKIKGLDTGFINGNQVGGLAYSELPANLKKKFDNFEITISIIENCDEYEVRTLFGRLQEGVSLNSAEKRNAIISNVGKQIESIALNHKFFEGCKISRKRYKHQDYLAHVFALMFYNNKEDLKSKLLEKLYLDNTLVVDINILKRVDCVLDYIHSLDNVGSKRIINKYTFIDLFWLLYESYPIQALEVDSFKAEFEEFERKRIDYRQRYTELLKEDTKEARELYDYILAYERSGALTQNISIRQEVFKNRFQKFIK